MVKIFKIIEDVTVYQSLHVADENAWSSEAMWLDCTPKTTTWVAPQVFCLEPRFKQGDFYAFHVGGLTATPEATEKVRTFFEMAGEILPVMFLGVEFSLLNVTECINCIDSNKSEWLINEPDFKAGIEKYEFFPDRYTESSLFKIPEEPRGGVFTYERSGDPDEEFKAFVESEGMTGLIFEEVWRSE